MPRDHKLRQEIFCVFAVAGETIWYDLELISELKKACKEIFPVVDYAYVSIPTYIGGQIGFILNSLNKETNFRVCFFTSYR